MMDDSEDQPPRKIKKRKEPKPPKPLSHERLEGAAFRHLERFACSAEELTRVLQRRVWRNSRYHEIDEDQVSGWISAIVSKMERIGLINDEAYAEMKTRSLANRGKGKRAIKYTLASKGLAEGHIANALDHYANDEGDIDQLAAINLVRRRRLGPMREPQKREALYDKDMGAMARAGIPLGLARKILDAEDEQALRTLEDEAKAGGDADS